MQELVLAAFVGLSLGNSWLCLFMAFGVSTAELKTGAWFLAGRTVGLIALGLLIVFAGMFLDISPKLMQAVAGLLAVAFGAILIVQNRSWNDATRGARHRGPGARTPHHGSCKHHGYHEHQHHGHGGRGCRATSPERPALHKACKKQYEVAPDGGGQCGGVVKDVEKAALSRSSFGFGLGVLRGITPCFKIVVLAPLMVAVSVYSALGMVLVFTAVSTVYPLIGFYSASTLHNLVKNRRMLMVIGGLIMIIIGIYYIYEASIDYGVHVPGSGGL